MFSSIQNTLTNGRSLMYYNILFGSRLLVLRHNCINRERDRQTSILLQSALICFFFLRKSAEGEPWERRAGALPKTSTHGSESDVRRSERDG